MLCFWRDKKHSQIERDQESRLEKAEGDLRDLRSRADIAMQILDDRHHRNHWRESIEQMITGAS